MGMGAARDWVFWVGHKFLSRLWLEHRRLRLCQAERPSLAVACADVMGPASNGQELAGGDGDSDSRNKNNTPRKITPETQRTRHRCSSTTDCVCWSIGRGYSGRDGTTAQRRNGETTQTTGGAKRRNGCCEQTEPAHRRYDLTGGRLCRLLRTGWRQARGWIGEAHK